MPAVSIFFFCSPWQDVADARSVNLRVTYAGFCTANGSKLGFRLLQIELDELCLMHGRGRFALQLANKRSATTEEDA